MAPPPDPMERGAAIPSKFDLLIAKYGWPSEEVVGVGVVPGLTIEDIEIIVRESERMTRMSVQYHPTDELVVEATKLLEIIQLRRGLARAAAISTLLVDIFLLTNAYTAYRGGDPAAQMIAMKQAHILLIRFEYGI